MMPHKLEQIHPSPNDVPQFYLDIVCSSIRKTSGFPPSPSRQKKKHQKKQTSLFRAA